jgi:hypothetical protein
VLLLYKLTIFLWLLVHECCLKLRDQVNQHHCFSLRISVRQHVIQQCTALHLLLLPTSVCAHDLHALCVARLYDDSHCAGVIVFELITRQQLFGYGGHDDDHSLVEDKWEVSSETVDFADDSVRYTVTHR